MPTSSGEDTGPARHLEFAQTKPHSMKPRGAALPDEVATLGVHLAQALHSSKHADTGRAVADALGDHADVAGTWLWQPRRS